MCTKWDECGLLYVSGELGREEAGAFEEHMRLCELCRGEFERYSAEREQLFAPDVLGEAPSEAVDSEILRVCTSARRPLAGFGVLSTLVSKPVAAVLFLLLGLGTGYYFAYHIESAKGSTGTVASESSVQDAEEGVAGRVQTADSSLRVVSEAGDTLDPDSLARKAPFGSDRKQQADQGVVPVDLQP